MSMYEFFERLDEQLAQYGKTQKALLILFLFGGIVFMSYYFFIDEELQTLQSKKQEVASIQKKMKKYRSKVIERKIVKIKKEIVALNSHIDTLTQKKYKLIKELKKFGFDKLPHDMSIALGTMSLSPVELAEHYTAFSNYGTQVKTHLIESVKQDDTIVYEKQTDAKTVSPATQAFIMTTILRDVVKRGTGRRANARGIELAGKTGTTNNNVDGWFAGYSPTIETVVWFGNDDNTPMYRRETGGRIAGPAFSHYYTKLLQIYPQIKRKFDVPEGIIETTVDGTKEYFSDISKPPKPKNSAEAQEELLF